jgi:hypothetical protein
MKKNLIVTTILLLLLALTAMSTRAQEWTKEQKEVWAVVESGWNAWTEKNLDKLLVNMHEQYMGWSNDSPLPMSKASVEKYFRKSLDKFSDMEFTINPARIVVTENAAVVHYYYSYSLKYGEEKKPFKAQGKYVEFYVKKGTSWLILGDFTYEMEPDDDD